MANPVRAGKAAWKYLKPIFEDLPEHFDWLASPRSGKHAEEIASAGQSIKALKEAGTQIDPSDSYISGSIAWKDRLGNPPKFPSTVEQALGSKKMPQSMAPGKLYENLTKYGARPSELDYIDLNSIPVNEKGKITLDAIRAAHDESLLGVLTSRRSAVPGAEQAGNETFSQRIREIEHLQTANSTRGDLTREEIEQANIRLEAESNQIRKIQGGQAAPDGRPWSEAKGDYPELYEKSRAFDPTSDEYLYSRSRDVGEEGLEPSRLLETSQMTVAERNAASQHENAYRDMLDDYTYEGKPRSNYNWSQSPATAWSGYTAGGAQVPATRHYENLVRDVSGSPFKIDKEMTEGLDEFRREFHEGGDFGDIQRVPEIGDTVMQAGYPIPLTKDSGLHYHWDEPNVLAHSRLQDVVVHDPVTGKPMRGLNINEIQSDYAQNARKIYEDITDIRFQDRLRSGDLDFFNEITADFPSELGTRYFPDYVASGPLTRATNLTPDDIRRGFTQGTYLDDAYMGGGGDTFGIDVDNRIQHLQNQFTNVLYGIGPGSSVSRDLGPQFLARARKAEMKRMRDEGITGFLSDSDMEWWDRFGLHARPAEFYKGRLPYGDLAEDVDVSAYRPGMLTQKGGGVAFGDRSRDVMPLSAMQMPPLYGRNDWERVALLDALTLGKEGFSGPSGELFKRFGLDRPGPYEFITWTPPEGVMATSGTPAKSAIQTYGYGPTETMSDIIERTDAYGSPTISSSGRSATYPEIYGPSYLGEARVSSPDVGVFEGQRGQARGALLGDPDYETFEGTPFIYNWLKKLGKGGPGIETHPVTHRFEVPEPTVGGDPAAPFMEGARTDQRMLRLSTPQVIEKLGNTKLLEALIAGSPIALKLLKEEQQEEGVYEHLYSY